MADFSEEATIMPGGGISKRPLHVIVAADCSGSMMGEKIQSLNYAIAVMIPQLAAWDQEQENASVFLRVVTFGDDARWHIAEPTPVADIRWVPLEIKEGAVSLDGQKIAAADVQKEFTIEKPTVLKLGRKFARVVPSN